MPISRLPTDAEAEAQGFVGADSQRRRDVLRETLTAFETCQPPDHFHQLASRNLRYWNSLVEYSEQEACVLVLPGDWGEVTQSLTMTYGKCFAVLNMANAYYPGGAYGEGAIAQEENIFRRTDCHFHVRAEHLDADGRTYTEEMCDLLTARAGLVYLDSKSPRVCIRGKEDRTDPTLGYPWLHETAVFPYYELRASAQDLRDGPAFDRGIARARIAAQLDTLIEHGLRHAVLGAFGCGAFLNPAEEVARLYREEIQKRASSFDVLAFAIYSAGYGRSNLEPFAAEFRNAA